MLIFPLKSILHKLDLVTILFIKMFAHVLHVWFTQADYVSEPTSQRLKRNVAYFDRIDRYFGVSTSSSCERQTLFLMTSQCHQPIVRVPQSSLNISEAFLGSDGRLNLTHFSWSPPVFPCTSSGWNLKNHSVIFVLFIFPAQTHECQIKPFSIKIKWILPVSSLDFTCWYFGFWGILFIKYWNKK